MAQYKYMDKVLADFFDDEEFRIQKRFYKEAPKKKVIDTLSLLSRDRKFSKQSVIKLLSNLTAKGAYNAINYIIRNSTYDYAINENGERVSAREVLKDWQQDFSDNKPQSKEAWHLCFSMKEEVNANNIYALKKSVQEIMQKHFYEYKYVYVLHIHQNNPHIHVVVNKNSMLTRKKLHFKAKDGIKNFFNEMREDYAQALNYHGKLNYHNAYKFEKVNILEKIEMNKQRQGRNYYRDTIAQLQKDKENITNKRNILQDKINKTTDIINQQNRERTQIVQELQNLIQKQKQYYAYKAERKKGKAPQQEQEKPQYIPQEQFDSIIQQLNAIKNLLKEYYKTRKNYRLEVQRLDKALNTMGFDFMKHRDTFAKTINEDYSNVLAKKSYLEFVLKHKNNATKEQLHVAKEIGQEIRHNAKEISQSIALQNELDKAVLQHLNVKTSSKSLLFAQRDIQKKLQVLQSMNTHNLEDTRLLEDYKNTLQTNTIVLDRVINDKILHYERIFNDEQEVNKRHVKTLQFYFNEFKTLTSYLDSKADDNTFNKREQGMSQFHLLQTKINNFLSQHEQEVKKQVQDLEQRKFYEDLIEWYLVDRKIGHVDYMRKSLTDKLNNNTLNDYFEKYDKGAISDYKVHLILLERKQKQQETNAPQKDNERGLSR